MRHRMDSLFRCSAMRTQQIVAKNAREHLRAITHHGEKMLANRAGPCSLDGGVAGVLLRAACVPLCDFVKERGFPSGAS